ncbi:MAG: hypothetical protein B6244_01755 [Candidatus Cloacimonetes bacterium 4572_55]|nr:MAG: hypothetical protein B6244_01755 [Candidatus Cloacimonetes bacterium 4572_55]
MIITDFSLRHSITVYVFIGIITVAGLISYIGLPRESTPDIKIPFIVISTPYFGVSPSDIEALVTQKIETELNTINDVKEIRSTSYEGMSVISVEFNPDIEVTEGLQRVRDKVDLAKPELPADTEEPIIQELDFSNWPILISNISGNVGLVRLKAIADDLKDEIENVPGVQKATVSGGLEREVQVDIDPERLVYYNLALQDVVETIQTENINLPGGTVDVGQYKFLVRIDGEFDTPDIISDLVLTSWEGKPIYIRDVATVKFGFKERDSYARENQIECVSLSINKRPGENIIRTTDQVKEILRQAEKCYHGVHISFLSDSSKEIRKMVRDLENNIISGLILVVMVLFMFLGIRNAVVVALAIPLSMLISFMILSLMGYTLNMVILFSLILALGMLVDNAIVIVENIFRHREEGYGLFQSASMGTGEVAWPVIASTATTLCAFGPMILWTGIMGEFMKYLPITLIVTLSSSLLVGLVVNPVLAKLMMGRGKILAPKKLSEIAVEDMSKLVRNYRRFLMFSLNNRVLVVGMAFAFLIFFIKIYGFIGKGVEFFPDTEPEEAYIDVIAPTGTRLDVSNSIVKKVEEKMSKYKNIKEFVANVGSSGGTFGESGSAPSHSSRLNVIFLDLVDRKRPSTETLEDIREELKDITGARVEVSKREMGPPSGPPINIEISGDDFKKLGEFSQEARLLIRDVKGVVNLKDDYEKGRPEILIDIDREKAILYGLSTIHIASTVRTAINGSEASKYRVGEDEYDITVRLKQDRRDTINDLQELMIAHEGNQIPLSTVATIRSSAGLSDIKRVNLTRVVTVSADVEGRNETQALDEIKEILEEKLHLPIGYFVSYTGGNQEQEESQAFLTKAFLIALFLMLLVLVTQFNSITLPIIILITVILSLVGVFVGLIVTRTPFGIIMTGIGVISLAGVVVNNAIVLIDYIVKLRDRGLSKFDAVVLGGMTRLRPVLLTAVTTILGLIPLTTGINVDFFAWEIEFGSESSQMWGPMGTAVIFGLTVATVLTLVVVPALYSLLDTISGFFIGLFGGKPEESQL